MFTTDISIRRKLPVINGFVSIPDGQRFLRTSLTPLDVLALIPGSTLLRLSRRGVNLAPIVVLDPTSLNLKGLSRQRERVFIQLPEFDRFDGPPEDWFAILREAASLV